MFGITAVSETTALSDETALSGKTALSDKPSYQALLGSRAFILDCWYIYPARNLIRHRGQNSDSRQLEPRLMRLLCLLAASADAVVTREDIINSLWPRVVVNENSLTRAISDLRRVLTPAGDKRSTLIQTIPKRGYRLTQSPEAVTSQSDAGRQAGTALVKTSSRTWLTRWAPSLAACFILALALTVRVSEHSTNTPVVAQLPETGNESNQPAAALTDRVIDDNDLLANLAGEAAALPTSLQHSESGYAITQLGYTPEATLPAWRMAAPASPGEQEHATTQGQAMLTPDGQLLAYVDNQDGIASLNLRPAMTDAEPWVAFTTDERILRLQWSPLDAGILMTVGQVADSKERDTYLRLMLLDLETLAVHELYRRALPAESGSNDIGNLT